MIAGGYVASLLIGISLGLIGGGGSILTVPVLVYLFGIDAALATVYSLFIVGTTSTVGAVSYLKKELVDLKTVLFFGTPSIPAIFLTRHYLLPAIPNVIFSAGKYQFTRDILLMVLFAILMIAAAYSMIRSKSGKEKDLPEKRQDHFYVLFMGVATGFITGLVGAGGGFLIIPALVNFLKMPVKRAIGTSLLIIALNSLTGFVFSLQQNHLNWNLLSSITILAITGIIIGSKFSATIKSGNLKTVFGWFILIMGIFIVIKETLFK